MNSNFVINKDLRVVELLEKMEATKNFSYCVVDEHRRLLGTITDGDLRRYLISHSGDVLKKSIEQAVNQKCFSIKFDQGLDKDQTKRLQERGIELVPIVGPDSKLLNIIKLGAETQVLVGDRAIGKSQKCFVIAEIGNNHQGDINIAKKLVDVAVEAKVDCVKFQMRDMDSLYGNASSSSNDLGVEYTLDLLRKYQLSDAKLFEAMRYAESKGLIAICTPWDLVSARKLFEFGVKAFKLASADLTNSELIDYLIGTKKPLFVSTGMSKENEVQRAAKQLNNGGASFVFLHCNSTYPAPYEQINLKYMSRLSELSDGIVGYSGHERGWHVPVAAVGMGANVIEKHITLDRGQEGVDHKVSLLPDELRQMMKQIRDVEDSLVGPSQRTLSQGELLNQQSLGKSIYLVKSIKCGEVITRDMLSVMSPGGGFKPYEMDKIVGRKVSLDLPEAHMLIESDFAHRSEPQRFDIPYDYGIPVRYHDYALLTESIETPLVEFHFSARDLELDPAAYLTKSQGKHFTVHCPELFSDEHLLDLASSDEPYRQKSVENVQNTITVSNNLRQYFADQEKVKLIINVGGWNTHGFLTSEGVEQKYGILRKSLSELDLNGIEFCIQTMPPFPWHFGGQSYHNLFVHPDEILRFMQETDGMYSLCFDTSHTLMAATYYGFDFYESLEKIKPYVKHYHVADAEGASGEGVEFGQGQLDLRRLLKELSKSQEPISFVPEVWQGHKNRGEGFIKALKMIQNAI